MLKHSVLSLSANLCRNTSVFMFTSKSIPTCALKSTPPWLLNLSYSLPRQLSTGNWVLVQQAATKPQQDPQVTKTAKLQQPLSAAKTKTSTAGSPDQILDRYPAIQHLRTMNFRDGKEPYKIYEGSLSSQLKSLKLFSITTSSMGLFMQPLIYQSLNEIGAAKALLAIAPVFLFTYITPVFIHFLSKRYIAEMIYNPATDTYTGVTYNFFLQRREFEFNLNDVIVPEVPGMLTTFLIKSKTDSGKTRAIFMMDTCFTHLEHYGRMMKFDQPVDLHLGNSSRESSGNSTRAK